MEELNILIEILEKSVEVNGVVPLTNKHLLNILKMVEKRISDEDTICDNNWDRFD